MIKNLLLVGLGGGLGSICRYIAGTFIQQQSTSSFPYGTLIVNILGSLLIGVLMGIVGKNFSYSLDIKLLFITGFCGGFTTFSTFSAENFQLLQNGQYSWAFIYTLTSITLGILAMGCGWWMTK